MTVRSCVLCECTVSANLQMQTFLPQLRVDKHLSVAGAVSITDHVLLAQVGGNFTSHGNIDIRTASPWQTLNVGGDLQTIGGGLDNGAGTAYLHSHVKVNGTVRTASTLTVGATDGILRRRTCRVLTLPCALRHWWACVARRYGFPCVQTCRAI